MLNTKEFEELKFFAKKVAEVHGPEHSEYIEINAIIKEINESKLDEINFEKLSELSNNYAIPEGACNAQTTLLNLLAKLDNNFIAQEKLKKWSNKKIIVNNKETEIYFNQGDIWWCSLGQNIKSESFGKGENFRRPILVLKKLSSDTCIAIPLSTKIKEGTWFTSYNLHGIKYTALLYQIRMLHKNRFWKKIGQLDENDFLKIKKDLAKLLELS